MADSGSISVNKRKGITRRAAIATATSAVATPAAARRITGGSVMASGQTISSITPASAQFAASTPNAPVTAFTVTMNPVTPAFSGTFSTGSPNSEGFHFVSGTLQAPAGGLAVGSYNDCPIIATQAGISNSPYTIAPTFTAIAAGGAFITAVNTPGFANTGNSSNPQFGYAFTTGSQNLSVTALGRWKVPGNTGVHTVSILQGAISYYQNNSFAGAGGAIAVANVNVGAGTDNSFVYATLPSPVILLANTQYFIAAVEPGEQYLQQSVVSTSAGGVLNGSVYHNFSGDTWHTANDGEAFGLVNFQYTTTTAIATLPGSPFPPPGREIALLQPPAYTYASNTVTVDVGAIGSISVGQQPPINSMTVQWFIDNVPYGNPVLGPQNDPTNAGVSHFPISINTLTANGGSPLSEGTHVLYPVAIDTGVGGLGGSVPAAFYMSNSGCNFIVQNSGPINGAQMIPVASVPGNSFQYPPFAEFINYNGDTQRAVNTFTYPTPTIPVWNGTGSVFAGTTDQSVMVTGDGAAYYVMDMQKNKQREFESDPSVVTTTSGGVMVGGTQFECGNTFDFGMVSRQLGQMMWSGGRYDSRVSSYVTWMPEFTDDGWIGCDHLGRVIWFHTVGSLAGTTEVIVGFDLDRTKLAYHELFCLSLGVNTASPPSSDATRLSRYAKHGTLASGGVDITNWGGLNGICQDPRAQNRFYVSNPLQNYILKIDKTTSPATYTKVAGVESPTGGYSNAGSNPQLWTFSGPYSILMTSDGVLLVGDRNNGAIRAIPTDSSGNPTGTITTLVGNQTNRPADQQASTADQSLAASGPGSISGTTFTSGTPTSGSWAPGQSLASPAAVGTYILQQLSGTTGGAGTYEINISQSVSSTTINSIVVPWNPSGSVSFTPGNDTSGAYINYPQTIKFAQNPGGTTASNNAWVVVWENPSNTVRLIDLAANTVTQQFQFGQDQRSSIFGWMDIDYNGVCMPKNTLFFARNNTWFSLCSLTGGFITNFIGNVGPYTPPGVFWQAGLTEGPLNLGPDLVLDPAQGAYPWAIAFAKTKAMFIISSFREIGMMVFRVRLSSDPDPQMPQANKNLDGIGNLMWQTGTCAGFPRGTRPSLGALHGSFGFGHLGSDMGKTTHDICVQYNNGSAAYNAAGDGEVLLNSVFLDPTGTAGADRTSGTPGANALGMGVTPRPEFNIESYDWQALSFFLRRSTTAGTFPTPALPGPAPTSTTPAIISNVHITTGTNGGLRTVTVTWDTSTPTIGIACCGTATNAAIPFGLSYFSPATVSMPYSAWSPIEPAFLTTGHSATITWAPNVSPLHVSVVVKDKTGNFSFLQDQVVT